jgi:hypothetical protein
MSEELKFVVTNKWGKESNGHYCNWRGRYTMGQVFYRGTAVGFFRNSAMALDGTFGHSGCFLDLKLDEEVADANESPDEIYPDEAGNIRSEDLDSIIESLKAGYGKCLRVFSGSFDKFFDAYKLEKPETPEMDMTTPRTLIMPFANPQVVLLATNLDGIIAELEEVLKLCKQNNVIFEWI